MSWQTSLLPSTYCRRWVPSKKHSNWHIAHASSSCWKNTAFCWSDLFFHFFFPLLKIVLNFCCICTLLISQASYLISHTPYFSPQAEEIPPRTGLIPQSLNIPLKGIQFMEKVTFLIYRGIPLPKEFCQWSQTSAQKSRFV